MIRGSVVVACLLVACPIHVVALDVQTDAVGEGRRLQHEGDFSGAIRVLRAHLAAHPDDGEAARLLAQTLYWMQEIGAARAAYESALHRHPDDHQLRVDYAQMLVETGDPTRARALLAPLAAAGTPRADVYALLGTLAYHRGDFTTAARLFEQALQIDPPHADAARQLREIRVASAPWIRLSPAIWHDDQPLDRRTVALEAGWFASPLTPVSIRVHPAEYESGAVTRRLWMTEVQVRHAVPGARIEAEGAAGLLRRTIGGDTSPEWTGRGVLGVRLPGHVTIRGRLERAPYLHTTASLSTRIAADTWSGELHVDHPRGWLAQAAVQQHRYADGNVIRTRYAWLLAPVVRSGGFDLQAGYAVSFEDAAESRFVLAAPIQPYDLADPRFDMSERYAPYYTPARVLKQSLAGAVRARVAPRVTMRLGGSYPLRATDEAPALHVADGGIERTFVPRAFRPFEVRAAIEVAATDDVAVSLTGEAGRTVFYRWAVAGMHLTYRFAGARRRAGSAP